MGGNLNTAMQWGGQTEGSYRRFLMDDDEEEEDEAQAAGGSRRRGGQRRKKPAKPRQSTGENYNSRANAYCHLTPWNKIEILAALSPASFGAVYASTFSLDEIDSALYIATGKTPNDKLLYRSKQLTLEDPRVEAQKHW